MKLRNKLKVSFLIMVILPITMFACAIGVLFEIQKDNIYDIYHVEEFNPLTTMYSSIPFLSKITEDIYAEIKSESELNPDVFSDQEYLKNLDCRLSEKMSELVVRKNRNIIYMSEELDKMQIYELLPAFDSTSNESDMSVYKGGRFQSIVKQVDFYDAQMNQYSISIITSVNQIVPQVKSFLLHIMITAILMLILTSLVLNLWIYGSIIKPVDKLKLATENIKMGNFDFEMPKAAKNEIGDVCRDFEEMRIILKQTSEDKLKSDMEEKELIRNISHDLKTPITAIKGYVEGILDGIADTPQKQEKYLKNIANKVNDMDRLIDELTIYSRLDTNRVPYTFNRINIKDYFDDCCEEISIDLEANKIKLDYGYHPQEDMYTYADTEQLKRVINNIISNSVKYMDDSREGHINIDVYDDGDYILINMQDNGKGISAVELPRIFERFYRTDSSRNSKQGGSGIGLAIVKKIIQDHKGKIWADSVEGEGTTMHMELLKDTRINGPINESEEIK